MNHVTYQSAMSHMNGSCHIIMNHVTYERVFSRIHPKYSDLCWDKSLQLCVSRCAKPNMNASCHTWRSHFTYRWVMSRPVLGPHLQLCVSRCTMPNMNESCHISKSHVTYRRVTSRRLDKCFQLCVCRSVQAEYKWHMSHVNKSFHILRSHVSTCAGTSAFNSASPNARLTASTPFTPVSLWHGPFVNKINSLWHGPFTNDANSFMYKLIHFS